MCIDFTTLHQQICNDIHLVSFIEDLLDKLTHAIAVHQNLFSLGQSPCTDYSSELALIHFF